MMAMNSSTGVSSGDRPGDAATGPTTSPPPTFVSSGSSRLSLKMPNRRRSRSKGTIAGFASAAEKTPSGSEPHPPNGDAGDNASVTSVASSGQQSSTQPQHTIDGQGSTQQPPAKPCHSSRLALLCVQNALFMGARTQVALCPPGRPRRSLVGKLQARRSRRKQMQQAGGTGSSGAGSRLPPRPISSSRNQSVGRSSPDEHGSSNPHMDRVFDEYDKAEDIYLANPDLNGRAIGPDGEEYIEEASSGDEDDLDVYVDDEDFVTSPTAALAAAAEKEKNSDYVHREPLFTRVGTDPSASGGQASMGGTGASGKLPFNYRKLRWFDSVTAADRAAARKFLREELANAKRRDMLNLTRHLRKMQRREKRRIQAEKAGLLDDDSTWQSDDDDGEEASNEPAALLAAGIGRLPNNMTPSLSAALVLESLSITPLESVEGMSKCYDGIVAAGTALLDWELENSNTAAGSVSSRQEEKTKTPSKSDIIAALAPHLITTLEHPAGETILELARLRKMCGSRRYQRRFVQRIAPCLVRPPNAAPWCLRHQNDMLAILAATEMIFDVAFEIFATGWYERGQTLLADSHRAETLRAAADALKELSSESSMMGLMTPGGGHSHRRGNSFIIGATPTKDSHSSKNSPLAEWEVLAVDRQIRKSISNILTMDWSRVVLPSAPPRDGDDASQGRGTRNRRGITSSKAKATASTATAEQPSSLQLELLPSFEGASGSATGTSTPTQPVSPRKIPLSPRSQNTTSQSPIAASASASTQTTTAAPSVEALESAFGPSFVTQTVVDVKPSTSTSPDSSPPSGPSNVFTAPLSPPRGSSGSRFTSNDDVDVMPRNRTVIGSSSVTPPQTPRPQHLSVASPSAGAIVPGTPPRSPSSPPRGMIGNRDSSSTTMVIASPSRGSSTPPLSSTGTRPLSSQGPGSDSYAINAPQIPQMSPPHRGSGRSDMELPTTPSRSSGIAPLSPSSLGADSLASAASQRAASSPGGVSSGLAVQSLQNAHYRMLTSTAAERKRTVAACRALRAQITRFEEAFIQLHGRPPKGAAERAPLATTYAQYREWKRAIRADAACRIQALFRGARTRWVLLRSNNPRIAVLIMKRPGRNPPGGDKNDLKRLAIPWEIGGNGLEHAPSANHEPRRQHDFPPMQSPSGATHGHQHPYMLPPGDEGSEISNVGVEVVISPGSQGSGGKPALSPNWNTNQPPSAATGPVWRNRQGSNEDDISRGMPPSESSISSRDGEHRGPTLQELQSRKRELKQQLKQYDMNFHRQYGRMPAKLEKEPIRHLYEKYNSLKSQISALEQESAGQGTAASSNYRRPSHLRQDRIGNAEVASTGDGSASPPNTSGRPSPPQGYGEPLPNSSVTSTPSGLPSQDLSALKAEKGNLHQMLRAYEKDFYKEHKRQVSSFADIRPVASQYRRYKEIKKQIASLQGQDQKG